METINTIELRDQAVFPDETVLRSVLGQSYNAYSALLELFGKVQLVPEWRYYNDGKAWLCKVQHKKRTIVWMSAWRDYMQATVYIPLKNIEAVYQLKISEESKAKISSSKNVGKSKPCTFEIRNTRILSDLQAVIEYKLVNK